MATDYGSLAVGTEVSIEISGVAVPFLVVHQGNPSTSYYDDSCDGTWLMLEYEDDLSLSHKWHSSANADYENSDVHSYLNTTFFNTIEAEVANLIKEVKIPYSQGQGKSATLKTKADGLTTKVFLPSIKEITTTNVSYVNNEGKILDYFANNAEGWKFHAYKNSTLLQEYWTRSPQTYNDAYVHYIENEQTGSGSYISISSSTKLAGMWSFSYYLRPMFIIDSGAPINGSVNIGGTLKELVNGHVNIGGVWKELAKAYENINGVWKES